MIKTHGLWKARRKCFESPNFDVDQGQQTYISPTSLETIFVVELPDLMHKHRHARCGPRTDGCRMRKGFDTVLHARVGHMIRYFTNAHLSAVVSGASLLTTLATVPFPCVYPFYISIARHSLSFTSTIRRLGRVVELQQLGTTQDHNSGRERSNSLRSGDAFFAKATATGQLDRI